MLVLAEYIWIDGTKPTARMRGKIKVVDVPSYRPLPGDFPEWNFDGSSTMQACGSDSDVKLKPVRIIRHYDEHRTKFQKYFVLCECYDHMDRVHPTNTRAGLRTLLDEGGVRDSFKPWIGFEQEYTIYSPETNHPLGFPKNGFPLPQGPYYCGVDGDVAFGRSISEKHLERSLDSGLMIYGTNGEVMPGQWEFQIGKRFEGEEADPLLISDQLWLARYILYRTAEEHNVYISLDCKPVFGDWNGSGCHTNFSTKQTRQSGGIEYIRDAIERLSVTHTDHIAVYGAGLSDRLTGLHETCDINTFRSGVADRGASIRIPQKVQQDGRGYFEDRRPGANIDPYIVSTKLLETVCVPEAALVS